MSLPDDLEALADELAPAEWLHEQAGALDEAELRKRLAWLHRHARAGISQRLVAFLGPETLVTITDGQILVRRYVGIAVRDV
jgi:hypothetical protein